MLPIKIDEKLVNLSQAAFVNLVHRDSPDDGRDAARVVFGPGKYLVLFGPTAEKFRKMAAVVEWSKYTIRVDELLINPDQIAHADLKFRSSVLLPPKVKDAVHIAFAAGNELNLLDGQAAKFRDAYQRLAGG